jgi:hypothetical protein
MPSLIQTSLSGTGVQPVDLGEAFRHRADFEDYVIHKAHPTYQKLLEKFYRWWHEFNHLYFADTMTPPYLMIDQPNDQLSYGGYEAITGFGGLTGIIVRESIVTKTHIDLKFGNEDPAGLERLEQDIVLHYAVRQYCAEVLSKPDASESGHGGTYVKECNRIGALLGLPDVGPARKTRNTQNLPTCAHWPWNVRPAGYYYGAYDYATVQAGRNQQKLQAAQKVGKSGVSGQALTLLNDEITRLKQQLAQVTQERDTVKTKLFQSIQAENLAVAQANKLAHQVVKTEAERDALLQATQPLPALADVKPVLAQAICQYGQAANFQALLNDYLPQQTLERHLLIAAWRAGYLARRANGEGQYAAWNVATILVEQHGIRYELAQWAVETWSEALALAPVPVLMS